jgi:hypothetical protein
MKFRIPEIFLGAFLAVAIFAMGMLFSSEYRYGDNYQRQSNPVAEHVTSGAEERLANYTYWLMLFTGVLAVSTIGLWIATWRSGKGHLAHSRAVERAHVFIAGPQHEFLLDEQKSLIGLRLWVTWKNSGTTPASPINALVGATWVPQVDQFKFGRVEQESIQQPFVLGPNAEIAGSSITISTEHILANLGGKGAQFLWGWARYKDIFPDSKMHVVEFCFRVTIEGQLGPLPFVGRVNFAFWGEHNRYFDEVATA